MHRKGVKYVTIGGGRGVVKYRGTVEVGAGIHSYSLKHFRV